MSPNAVHGEGVAGSQPMSTAVHRSPNKLWRSKSTLNLGPNPLVYPAHLNLLLHRLSSMLSDLTSCKDFPPSLLLIAYTVIVSTLLLFLGDSFFFHQPTFPLELTIPFFQTSIYLSSYRSASPPPPPNPSLSSAPSPTWSLLCPNNSLLSSAWAVKCIPRA
jgi:hypothetical protein